MIWVRMGFLWFDGYCKMLWVLTHDIYEPEGAGTTYPVVRHQMFGRTREEAERYFRSHQKTDVFLRDCIRYGRWGQVQCVSEPPEIERIK